MVIIFLLIIVSISLHGSYSSYSESLNPPWKEIIFYGVAELSVFFQPRNYSVFGLCVGTKLLNAYL